MRFETIFGEGASPFSLYGRIKNKTLQYKTDHIRDFVHVDDIAECLNMFINMRQYVYNLKSVYEIGTGNEHKVSDVVDHFGLDVPLKITDNSYEVDRSVADITEINKLGWVAKRSIYE